MAKNKNDRYFDCMVFLIVYCFQFWVPKCIILKTVLGTCLWVTK